MAPSLVGCPALSWADAAGCRLVRPGQELAGCGILGDPRVNAGSPVGRVRVPKTLGLWPTHWEVKPGPGVGARLQSGRAGSWGLAAGPGIPELFQIIVGGGRGRAGS